MTTHLGRSVYMYDLFVIVMECFVVARVNCLKGTMYQVICVLNDQLLEWLGQFMETMKDSWTLTTDHTQVYSLPY